MPGTWLGSHWGTSYEVSGMTWPGQKSTAREGAKPRSAALQADVLTTRPTRPSFFVGSVEQGAKPETDYSPRPSHCFLVTPPHSDRGSQWWHTQQTLYACRKILKEYVLVSETSSVNVHCSRISAHPFSSGQPCQQDLGWQRFRMAEVSDGRSVGRDGSTRGVMVSTPAFTAVKNRNKS